MGISELEQGEELLNMPAGMESVEVVIEERVGFDKVRGFMAELFKNFRNKWKTSTRLVVDESMFGWMGVTDA